MYNVIGRAVHYQTDIDHFVARHRDLRALELDEDEWAAIRHVTEWLEVFRHATTQMSTTKGASVLSTTHCIFRGLQAHIVNIIRNLPESLPIITKNDSIIYAPYKVYIEGKRSTSLFYSYMSIFGST
jgi:hypothetical protein